MSRHPISAHNDGILLGWCTKTNVQSALGGTVPRLGGRLPKAANP